MGGVTASLVCFCNYCFQEFDIMQRIMLAFTSGIALTIASASSALAISGFTGEYAPGKFTFTDTPSGAGTLFDNIDAGTGEVIIYGADTLTNSLGTMAATIDWTTTVTAAGAGTVSFDWTYNPFDTTPGDDSAGYLLNGVFTTLATNDGTFIQQTSGSAVQLVLSEGQTFGFRVKTLTNTNGEGQFTVRNFEATPVPFETDASLGLLVLGGLYGGHRWLKSRSNSPLS